jgi:hypothetical protein
MLWADLNISAFACLQILSLFAMIDDDSTESLLKHHQQHDRQSDDSSGKRIRTTRKTLLERMGFRNSTTSDKCLGCFLCLCFIGPLVGVIPYLMFSHDTVVLFYGVPTETADFWCSMVSSVELTICFVCLMGLVSSRVEIKQLAVCAFGVYAISHFGLFVSWGLSHLSIAWNALFVTAIALSLLAVILWGIPLSVQRPRLWM